ncbi:peptidylprolyl isomerase [Leekyejoonella antrihumi]|uniref:Peptidylprolyl isomerase n=2 Tax=Leekyejoonella antrihumi TaxID=1660198 RepID=A0A563E4A5_9MICO|nr:peptidylprolyl isomerase [Leekyejoonella antrihumi]
MGLAGCSSTPATGSSSAQLTAKSAAPGSLHCAKPPAHPSTAQQEKLPDKSIAAGKTFQATISTTCGPITVQLDGTKAPQAVASFLQLAKGYWDNSPCHRLTTAGIYVLQCGDPTGTGSGTPGYGFGIENAPADNAYPAGTLAMARTQSATGNGGQFFFVYRDSTISPDQYGGYTIFGQVTTGLNVLKDLADEGTSTKTGDGPPKQPISILKITVIQKKA